MIQDFIDRVLDKIDTDDISELINHSNPETSIVKFFRLAMVTTLMEIDFEKGLRMIKFERVTGYEDAILPKRATKGSAGYDFYLTSDIDVKVGEEVIVPTGIRVKMPENVVLVLVPRSGLGFKYGMRFSNTVGIIDSDYYYSDNEGHMMCKFSVTKDLKMNKGDRFMQGIFVNYWVTDDDNADGIRNGGFGSTSEGR